MIDSQRHTVLVVDDEADTRQMLRELLVEEGYAVVEAGNGREALEWLTVKGARPCVIVLDLLMPEMAGQELLSIIKSYSRLSRIPVIILSAVDLQEDARIRSQFAAYLTKPLHYERLLHAIRATQCSHASSS